MAINTVLFGLVLARCIPPHPADPSAALNEAWEPHMAGVCYVLLEKLVSLFIRIVVIVSNIAQ